MQRSTEGSPAYSERRASAWQYWQAIWNDPAWITWLKRIGWRGALGPITSGLAVSGWEGGEASARRERVSFRVSASGRYPENGGIVGAGPSAGPPRTTTLG